MPRFAVILNACYMTMTLGIAMVLTKRTNGFVKTILFSRNRCIQQQSLVRSCQSRRSTIPFVRRFASTDTTPVKPEVFSDDGTNNVMASVPSNLQVWFDVSLPEGRCIGVQITNETECFPTSTSDGGPRIASDHWIYRIFHPDEIDLGMQSGERRRDSFWLGRLAMRIGLDFPDYPILRDTVGRPQLHADVFGSISHKENKGVAIISPTIVDDKNPDLVLSGIGIDLELSSRPGKRSISRRVLTENEQQALGNLPGVTVEEEVLLRFSLKEAIYKAAHPLLCQYVGMREAEVTPFADGTASCEWFLDNDADKRIAKLTAHWRKLPNEPYFLTSASTFVKLESSIDQ